MNKHNCPKCNAEFELGTKFCQNCGCNLENEFIETPTCPECKKVYPTGTKFCNECGVKLVSPDKLIPRCEKCGKEYSDGIKFCPIDGGRILYMTDKKNTKTSNTENEILNKGADIIDNFADKSKSMLSEVLKKWHAGVFVWSLIALAINAIVFIVEFVDVIRWLKYINFTNIYSILILISPILTAGIIYSIVLMWKFKKSGFALLVIIASISVIMNIILLALSSYGYQDNLKSIILGIISIIVWYAILQVKKNDVSAWNTLK